MEYKEISKINNTKPNSTPQNNSNTKLTKNLPPNSKFNSSPFQNDLKNQSSLLSGPSFFGVPITPQYPGISNINYYESSQADNYKNNQFWNQIEETFNKANKEVTENTKSNTYISNSFPFTPILQNIVSTANLRCILELREISLRVKNAEYNPKRFSAVIMRIKEPKTTALIFASGKIVCTGAKSEEDSKIAAKKYAKIWQKIGYPVKFSEFKIQNIVASCDVKFPIRLEGWASKYLKFSSYEPEMFPGWIFHMVEPKIVLLIFVSGKIVWTGAKYRDDIFKAFQEIYPVLMQFRKIEIRNWSEEKRESSLEIEDN